MYRAPKTILNHPGVLECDSAEAGGADPEDYTHDVLLQQGWEFTFGRMTGCRTGMFKTVADFRQAAPRQKPQAGTLDQIV